MANPTVPLRVLVGGVGYRWQMDGSIGLLAADVLAEAHRPQGVDVADLGYGALLVAQDLAAADPPYDRLILLAGKARGREPGSIDRYRWAGRLPGDEEIQARIAESGAGVIDVDHLLIVCGHFAVLPPEVIVIEAEPYEVAPGVEPSGPGEDLLARVVERAREEALAPADGMSVRGAS